MADGHKPLTVNMPTHLLSSDDADILERVQSVCRCVRAFE